MNDISLDIFTEYEYKCCSIWKYIWMIKLFIFWKLQKILYSNIIGRNSSNIFINTIIEWLFANLCCASHWCKTFLKFPVAIKGWTCWVLFCLVAYIRSSQSWKGNGSWFKGDLIAAFNSPHQHSLLVNPKNCSSLFSYFFISWDFHSTARL